MSISQELTLKSSLGKPTTAISSVPSARGLKSMKRMPRTSTEICTRALRAIGKRSQQLKESCTTLVNEEFTPRTMEHRRALSHSIRILEEVLEIMKDFSKHGSVCILVFGLGIMLSTPNSSKAEPSEIASAIVLSISTDPTDYYLKLWLGSHKAASPKCVSGVRFNSKPHFPSCNCYYKSMIHLFFKSQRLKTDPPPYRG